MITSKVRVNKLNGQKTLTVPKNAPIYKDDLVMLVKIEEPTQMNNEKEVQDNGRSTGDNTGSGYDSGPGTTTKPGSL